jgi:hypothetical protein
MNIKYPKDDRFVRALIPFRFNDPPPKDWDMEWIRLHSITPFKALPNGDIVTREEYKNARYEMGFIARSKIEANRINACGGL